MHRLSRNSARRFWAPTAQAKRRAWSTLIHPEVLRRLRAWVAAQSVACATVAAVIPLLFEIGDEGYWDLTVCVGAPEADQRARLQERGLSAEESWQRLRAQQPLAWKIERADRVIYNCGSMDVLREQTDRLLKSIRGE